MTLISSKDVGLSFGIELEIIFCHKQKRLWPPSQDTKVSEKEEAVLPPVFETPFSQEGSEMGGADNDNTEWVEDEIEKIIKTVPGAKCRGQWGNVSKAEGPEFHPSIYITPDTAWAAKPDFSVVDDRVYEPLGYNTTGIEIVSPAMWDCPEAHRHVQDVVSALSRTLRWRVNIRTGFHVHVGAGARQLVEPRTGELEWKAEKFDFKVLQRAAALIWAADHFLCYAHPPERQLNYYAQPIALTSQLAIGQEYLRIKLPAEEDEDLGPWDSDPWGSNPYRPRFDSFLATHTNVSGQVADRFPNLMMPPRPPNVPGFEPPSTRLRPELQGKSEGSCTLLPSTRPSQVDGRAYDRARPYLPGIGRRHTYENEIRNADITIEKGIAYIMRPDTRHKIAKLLSHADNEHNRLNYNFTNYEDGGGRGYNTIEFREATGTLDPTTIAAWSNVCLAVFRFSTVASDAAFWHTIWNLIDAHNDGLAGKPHNYDMISLMVDCGAAGEAAFFERSLRELGDKHWYTSITNNKRVIPDASLDGSLPQESRRNDETPWMPSPVLDDLDNETSWSPPPPATPTYPAASASPTVPKSRFFNRGFAAGSSGAAAAAGSPPTSQQQQQRPQQGDSHQSHTGWRPQRPSSSPPRSDTSTDPFTEAANRTIQGYKQRQEELTAQADEFDAAWERLGFGKGKNSNGKGLDISTNF